jgi:hypothetical protein
MRFRVSPALTMCVLKVGLGLGRAVAVGVDVGAGVGMNGNGYVFLGERDGDCDGVALGLYAA